MNRPNKFVAELEHVREVSLIGLADLVYWKERMTPEGLTPVDVGGKVQMVISGTNARYKGVAFRELCFGIRSRKTENETVREGLFLPYAYHSSRFFGWIERFWFSAPYYFSRIDVDVQPAPHVALRSKYTPVLELEMGKEPGGERAIKRSGPETWEGPIFLPTRKETPSEPGNWFYAVLSGETRVHEFRPDLDVFRLVPDTSHDILNALIESRFTPTEWMIREDARHAKSHTHRS